MKRLLTRHPTLLHARDLEWDESGLLEPAELRGGMPLVELFNQAA